MSATSNLDAMINQGEFTSRVPPSEPLTTKGHKPGVKVGNDAAPEFSKEVYPPGTAPSENTFQPNTGSEIPSSIRSDPLDMPGSTSADVYNETQFGKPMQGQTSTEHHGSKKKDSSGVESRITSGYPGVETGDGSVDRKVRGLGADLAGRAAELKGQKGASGATEGGTNWVGAEEMIPTTAEELSAERPKGGHAGVASNERAEI